MFRHFADFEISAQMALAVRKTLNSLHVASNIEHIVGPELTLDPSHVTLLA